MSPNVIVSGLRNYRVSGNFSGLLADHHRQCKVSGAFDPVGLKAESSNEHPDLTRGL